MFEELVGGQACDWDQIIEARGLMDKLMTRQVFQIVKQQKYKDHAMKIILYVFLWVRSSRNLFGEVMMTMRPIPDLIDAVVDCRLESFLISLLRKKCPTFLIRYAALHVRHSLEIFSNIYNDVRAPADVDDLNAMLEVARCATESYVSRVITNIADKDACKMLILVSLLDTSMSNESMPYPEFSLRYQKIHPFLRIAHWCCYMAARSTAPDVPQLFDAVKYALRSQMTVIDVPMTFPQLCPVSSAAQPEHVCEVLCASAHPSQLQELCYALQRGYTIDTERAIEYWSRNFVTDIRLFDRIVSIYPLLLPQLVHEGPHKSSMESMLRSLIQLSTNVSLAQRCADYLGPEEAAANNPLSTFYVAKWKLYRFSSLSETVAMLYSNSQALMDLLAWASKFGYNSLEVRGNVSARTQVLAAHVVICMHRLGKQLQPFTASNAVTRKEYKVLVDLTSNLFCDVLIDPRAEGRLFEDLTSRFPAGQDVDSTSIAIQELHSFYVHERMAEPGLPNAVWMLLADSQVRDSMRISPCCDGESVIPVSSKGRLATARTVVKQTSARHC
jgi:hypothetical protein